MNLQEQIAEFKAKGCVAGGRKWEVFYTDTYLGTVLQFKTTINDFHIEVGSINCGMPVLYITQGNRNEYFYKKVLTSEKPESALIEALEIVKAKVIELAKELGFVCFDKEQVEDLQDGLGAGYRALELEYDIEIDENVALDKHISMQKIDELMGYIEEQLQQYIEEQGNDSIQQNT